jgi:hypothetical protein
MLRLRPTGRDAIAAMGTRSVRYRTRVPAGMLTCPRAYRDRALAWIEMVSEFDEVQCGCSPSDPTSQPDRSDRGVSLPWSKLSRLKSTVRRWSAEASFRPFVLWAGIRYFGGVASALLFVVDMMQSGSAVALSYTSVSRSGSVGGLRLGSADLAPRVGDAGRGLTLRLRHYSVSLRLASRPDWRER